MNNDNIGIDPSLYNNIDSLEGGVKHYDRNRPPIKQNKNKKPMNKGVFTVLVILSMVFVGCLIYFYLNMAKKKNQEIILEENIKVKDIYLYKGEDLPTKMEDYVSNQDSDLSKCKLDTKNINTSKVGKYVFNLNCHTKYSGNVYITDIYEGDLSYVMKKKDSELNASDFIKDESYSCRIVNDVNTNSNGLFKVRLLCNKEDNYYLVEEVLYVTSSDYRYLYSCVGDDIKYLYIDNSLTTFNNYLTVETKSMDSIIDNIPLYKSDYVIYNKTLGTIDEYTLEFTGYLNVEGNKASPIINKFKDSGYVCRNVN